MAGTLIEIPTIDYSDMYYPDILKMLIQYRREHAPEVTEENEYEPYVQLERAYALVGHLNNVLLDVVANESLLPTAKLLESVRNHLRLIDYHLALATPASTDVIYELSKVFTATTDFVPQNSQSGTEETEERASVLFEAVENHTIDRTDEVSYVFSWNSGSIEIVNNTFDAGDTIIINTANFIYATHFTAGIDTAATAQNLADAINTSTNDNIFGKIKAIVYGSKISLVNLDDSTEITVTKIDGVTLNFNISSGSFSSDNAATANTDAVFFTVFTDPKPGDCLYFGHKHVQEDKIVMSFNVPASGITGVWEYYDGELEDVNPTTVTNLGSNLKFNVSELLPDGTDCTGTIVRVKLQETSAFEDCVSYYDAGTNYIETTELLGQVSPSTD